jgi:hypothetical protein
MFSGRLWWFRERWYALERKLQNLAAILSRGSNQCCLKTSLSSSVQVM